MDTNRAWLHAIEFLLPIAPRAKLIGCLRNLGQIYDSIEAQHQKTILINLSECKVRLNSLEHRASAPWQAQYHS